MYQFFGEDEILLGFDIEKILSFYDDLEVFVRELKLSDKERVACVCEIRIDLQYRVTLISFDEVGDFIWKSEFASLDHEIKWMYADDFLCKAQKYLMGNTEVVC